MTNLEKALTLLDLARGLIASEVSRYRVKETDHWLPLREIIDDIDHVCEAIETYQKEKAGA
jgi:hypothetical protein